MNETREGIWRMIMRITFKPDRPITFFLRNANMTIDPIERTLELDGNIRRRINVNDPREINKHIVAYMNNGLISVPLYKIFDLTESQLMPALEEVTYMVMQSNADIYDILDLWEDDRGESLSHYVIVETEK